MERVGVAYIMLKYFLAKRWSEDSEMDKKQNSTNSQATGKNIRMLS